MKNITKWYILIAALALALLWNVLCLLGALPIGKWPFCLTIGIVCSAVVLLPVWFPKRFPKNEPPPKDPKNAPKTEKAAVGVVVGLFAAWLVTVAACIVYPL